MIAIFYCNKCNKKTILSVCETCGKKTKKKYYCSTCGLIDDKECRHGPAATYLKQTIDIKYYFDTCLKKLNIKTYPDLIKGVRGTSNKDHIPEHFIKGIFRARYDICVNKDGTIRYDMTQLPITHFKPKEINTSVEKLKSIGYIKDIFGSDLSSDEQILELMPQDLILPSCSESPELGANEILLKISFFVDDLLNEFYKIDKFFLYEATYKGFSEKHEERIIKFVFALFGQNYISISEKGDLLRKHMLIPIGIRFKENS
ncbi:MAG: hypothetical protein IIA83_05830, partial [Thaumarchaeota archaeon]|nr:hypothetical protein [Nitrososphaerota archaeon]